jgi:hypothetical protein
MTVTMRPSAAKAMKGLVIFVLVWALYLAAMSSWLVFALVMTGVLLLGWRRARKRGPADAGVHGDVIVSRCEAARLLGLTSVTGPLIWGELASAQQPSGEMGVLLSSVHREMEWQDGAGAGQRLWRALSFFVAP